MLQATNLTMMHVKLCVIVPLTVCRYGLNTTDEVTLPNTTLFISGN
jgi:hypothetical protein